jgi:hypothetical protein
MAKNEKPASKGNDSKGTIREEKRSHIGDNIKAWQPVTDKTTTPPKGTPDKKK